MTASEVADAFDFYLDDRDESRVIDHFLERLAIYLPGHWLDAANRLLDTISNNPMASTDALALVDELLGSAGDDGRLLIDTLIDDHYLTRTRGQVVWRYDVFRRIWIYRRGLSR